MQVHKELFPEKDADDGGEAPALIPWAAINCSRVAQLSLFAHSLAKPASFVLTASRSG